MGNDVEKYGQHVKTNKWETCGIPSPTHFKRLWGNLGNNAVTNQNLSHYLKWVFGGYQRYFWDGNHQELGNAVNLLIKNCGF